MNKSKIALAMICRGTGKEVENLRRALKSVATHVDGIFITLTSPRKELKEALEVCKEFNVNVSYNEGLFTIEEDVVKWLTDFLGYPPHMKIGDKLFLFDEARNFNFSQVPESYDWILWMDTDDVLRRGENLRNLAELGMKKQVEAWYFNYIYQADLMGEQCVTCNQKVDPEKRQIKHVIIEHVRERLVRNIGIYKWIAPIHETLIEQRPSMKVDSKDCDILHLATYEDRFSSLTRNLKNLEYAVYQSKGKDPRHLYYLAKAYFDMRTIEYFDKAIPLINAYLWGEHKSGWPQERAQACEYLAEIYRSKNELNNAVKSAMNGLIESPESPSIFLNLAITYMTRQEWERALFWVKVADHIPLSQTTLVSNPRDIEGMKYEVIYNCCLNMGKIDEAWAAAYKMRELSGPNDPIVNNICDYISQLKEKKEVTKTILTLADYLKSTGQRHKIKPLLAATPQIAEDTPFIIELNQKNNPPTYFNKDDIAIYCGPGFTPWSPKKLENPGECFLGGSEEAVVYMSEALAKEGWRVTVYADPSEDEGMINGVNWLPYYKFNKQDHFNILIIWRQLGYFDQEIHAKKKYLWNHDIQNPLEWTPERYNKLTKAFFLSKWHRDNVPLLPEEKVMITSNGINI